MALFAHAESATAHMNIMAASRTAKVAVRPVFLRKKSGIPYFTCDAQKICCTMRGKSLAKLLNSVIIVKVSGR